ncbi:chorismate--pyruvate lyase family protein [Moraxella haemolytica]|uniref:chorismate--pyruvate lyase family protein n=1 Tax=Moraxella haemolytica TaxID=2904119 RepID=UPI002542EE4A|nr:chorismate lyase [Moraxella sp. ZY171148]
MLKSTNNFYSTLQHQLNHQPFNMTPPNALLPYLHAQGSLTALLEAKAKQPLKIKIIHEGYDLLNTSQKSHLNLPLHRPALAWVREVLLSGQDGDDDTAWVHAKSIFPISSLKGDAKRLCHLKYTPIGYVMFNKNQTLPYKRRLINDFGQFGRITIYDWHTRPILIQEVFLNTFVQSLL